MTQPSATQLNNMTATLSGWQRSSGSWSSFCCRAVVTSSDGTSPLLALASVSLTKNDPLNKVVSQHTSWRNAGHFDKVTSRASTPYPQRSAHPPPTSVRCFRWTRRALCPERVCVGGRLCERAPFPPPRHARQSPACWTRPRSATCLSGSNSSVFCGCYEPPRNDWCYLRWTLAQRILQRLSC